jgi:hypothetical protein
VPIDDNHSSREAVLARVRTALGRKGTEDAARSAALAYIATRKQGPRPALPADLVQRFLTRAADMESTVERVATLDDVAPAIGRYVAALGDASSDPTQNPRAGVCWPEFGWLDWKSQLQFKIYAIQSMCTSEAFTYVFHFQHFLSHRNSPPRNILFFLILKGKRYRL